MFATVDYVLLLINNFVIATVGYVLLINHVVFAAVDYVLLLIINVSVRLAVSRSHNLALPPISPANGDIYMRELRRPGTFPTKSVPIWTNTDHM